ncbi:yippee zinc-binding/DNA-binding /Mis18, centromere assembly-domain-containing protein, partial [Limtongia smithiae]|uniref:yippee zinc-binding/DNA-binding /Mis18, centromere assembly-domain-containing protein n=1 Tax=Limtongia smithiae TaxID=1125753 RepID=UPI0034CDEA14
STISPTLALLFVAFLLWQVFLATLIVRPAFLLIPANRATPPGSPSLSGSGLSAAALFRRRQASSSSERVINCSGRTLSASHFTMLFFLGPPRRRSYSVELPDDVFEDDEFSLDGSNVSSSPASPSSPPAILGSLMSAVHPHPLTIYCCAKCQTHIVPYDAIISKSFTGRFGRAVLVSGVMNINIGKPFERMLITGLHSVADIFCANCHINVGWKYLATHERSQKYKVGKYILELRRVVKETEVVDDDDEDAAYFTGFDTIFPIVDSAAATTLQPSALPHRRCNTSSMLRELLDNDAIRANVPSEQ